MNKIKKRLITLLILFSIFVPTISDETIISHAADLSETVSGVAYSFGDRGNYELGDSKAISIDQRIASISVSGDFNLTTKFNNVPAYGVKSGNVKISLVYDGKWLNESGNKFLLSDSGKTINGQKMDAKVGKGAVLIQKSYDGTNWQLATNPLVNAFENHKKGIDSLYTTAGSDVKRGCYYRIIIAYKYQQKQKDKYNLGLVKFDGSENDKVAEVYTFFICNNAGELSLHNKSVDQKSITDIADGIKAEALLKGETLLEGSATKDGFTIDNLGVAFKSIKVNGQSVGNKSSYEIPGKYIVEGTTRLDYTVKKTVYIYDGGKDKGFSDYFGDNLVKGNRVFREGEYPSYGKGAKAQIKALKDELPDINGSIENLTTGEIIEVPADRKYHSYNLDEGEYFAEFYSGNIEAGSVIHYVFHFNVLSEESKPYVNYNELMSNTRICDLNSAHYEVVFQTTRGGYIFVCFESEEEAFKYAYDIEKRFIENKDGEIYYKALDNPNEKVKYPTESDKDKMALTSAINFYASQNVEKAYFDTTKTFTYQTFDKGDDLLASLETLSIAESVKVFPSEEEKEKLIKRMPYLNGFTFVHVDDYDVKSVEAECKEDGKKYSIKFGKLVDEQLNVTSKYVITETNKYGDKFSYDTYFMAKNETTSTWTISRDGKTSNMDVDSDHAEDGIISISADTISLEKIDNSFDEYAILAISSKGAYKYDLSCLLKEAKGLILYKKGEYSIKFVDRTGNSYELKVDISGNADDGSFDKGSYHTYTDIYNAVHLNDKDEND